MLSIELLSLSWEGKAIRPESYIKEPHKAQFNLKQAGQQVQNNHDNKKLI